MKFSFRSILSWLSNKSEGQYPTGYAHGESSFVKSYHQIVYRIHLFLKKISVAQRNTLIIIFSIGIIKIAGFLKDMLLTNFFGVDRNVDIYFCSLILPILLFNIFSAAWGSFFIPTYLRIKSGQGSKKARNYTTLIIFYAGFLALLLGYLCGWVIPAFVLQVNSTIFHFQKEILIFLYYSKLTAVFFFFYLFSSLFSSLFQAEHRYVCSFFPQLAIPLATIIFILLYHERYTLASALYGMTWGAMINCFISYGMGLKLGMFDLLPQKLRMEGIGTNLGQLGLLILATIFPGLIYVLDQYMAANLGVGQLSILNYGLRIPDSLSEILGLGIGIAAFSHFSQWMVDNNKSDIIAATQKIIMFSTLFIIPFCFYLIIFSELIIHVLFERGAFSSAATIGVGKILQFYALSSYFFVIGVVGTRLISAMTKNHFILIVGFISIVLKVILNFVFIPLLGLKGIPLATLVMYSVGIGLSFYFISQAGFIVFDKRFVKALLIDFFFIAMIYPFLFFTYLLSSSQSNFATLSTGLIVLCVLIFIVFLVNNKFQVFSF